MTAPDYHLFLFNDQYGSWKWATTQDTEEDMVNYIISNRIDMSYHAEVIVGDKITGWMQECAKKRDRQMKIDRNKRREQLFGKFFG